MKIKLNVKIKNDTFIIYFLNKLWFIQKILGKNKVLTFFYIFIILKKFGFINQYK